jgi:hypothetical protein
MEPDVSVPCSQESASGPYSASLECTPTLRVYFCRSVLILFSHLHLGLPIGPFPSGFPNKICTHSISLLEAHKIQQCLRPCAFSVPPTRSFHQSLLVILSTVLPTLNFARISAGSSFFHIYQDKYLKIHISVTP